jgi:transitional endoplasmic reticulum ATPase
MPESNPEIEGLRTALAVSPENNILRGLLGDALLKYGHLEEATRVLEEAVRKERDSWPLKIKLARALKQVGKQDQALMVLSGLTRADSPPAEGLLLLARLQAGEGELAAAAKTYASLVNLSADHRDLGLEEELFPFYQPEGNSAETNAPGEEDEEMGGMMAAPALGGAKEIASPMEKPDVDFSDVGGMEGVKEEIRMKIILPLQHPELFKAYGKKTGGGILLYGPPGCGKTHIARCTAGEVGASFMAVGISDVLDMWIGASERNLREIFEQARRRKPCVLFFDEVDALGASRTDLKHSAGRNTINQFLSELDGVDTSNDGVLILAATNAPWHLDSAFRRPGRFDRIIFVPPADQEGRESILRVLLKNKPSENVDFAKVAKATDTFSGADLQATVDLAIEDLLTVAMKTGKIQPVRTADLLNVAKKQRPTTREWFATAKNYAMYANQGGHYDEILQYLNVKR